MDIEFTYTVLGDMRIDFFLNKHKNSWHHKYKVLLLKFEYKIVVKMSL